MLTLRPAAAFVRSGPQGVFYTTAARRALSASAQAVKTEEYDANSEVETPKETTSQAPTAHASLSGRGGASGSRTARGTGASLLGSKSRGVRDQDVEALRSGRQAMPDIAWSSSRSAELMHSDGQD
eukprot:2234172-Pleurochrysis_carterae.AAC.1